MLSEDIYLTSNIVIINKQSYYLDENSKKKKITLYNWQNYLDEYGWEDIDEKWQEKLLNGKKNNRYGVLDCGGEGDCLFFCIIEALGKFNMDVENLRNIVAYEVDDNNFHLIIENYKLEKENNEFDGLWDPMKINCIEDLRNEIRTSGDNFWGDHIIIQLLEKALNINIIILNTDELIFEENNFKIQPRGNPINKKNITVFLSYCFSSHFQLVGYFDGKIMNTKFDYKDIPKVFKL
tara:strand:- start:1865 stop:2572 length:708 start_codon:yes stop_codon:yes gene_type:complete